MKSFLSRFHALVCFVLSGFDRLRFSGESRLLNHVGGVNSYMYQRGMLRRDFPKHSEELTRHLREESYAQAERQGVPLLHLNSPKVAKDVIALELARTHNRGDGRIALLTSMEPGMTYRLRQTEDGLVEPRKETTRCLHLYHYFLHDRFGLCYVRVQTWFPFTIHWYLIDFLAGREDFIYCCEPAGYVAANRVATMLKRSCIFHWVAGEAHSKRRG